MEDNLRGETTLYGKQSSMEEELTIETCLVVRFCSKEKFGYKKV